MKLANATKLDRTIRGSGVEGSAVRLSIKQLRSLKAFTLRSCLAGERTAGPSAALGMTN
jgi:hypothetical protein